MSYNYGGIKVDSYGSLPLEKAMTLGNVIILVKSDWNKDKNNYYYNIFLQKASYELHKKNCINNILSKREVKMNLKKLILKIILLLF